MQLGAEYNSRTVYLLILISHLDIHTLLGATHCWQINESKSNSAARDYANIMLVRTLFHVQSGGQLRLSWTQKHQKAQNTWLRSSHG
jgi:hypothetical protein